MADPNDLQFAVQTVHRLNRSVAGRLQELARAFDVTGNLELAQRLGGEARQLREIADALSEAYDNEQRRLYRETAAQAGHILTSLLGKDQP